MDQSLYITQKQTLQINARLQQQLKLLHMALPEVCEAVENALNSNPLLERGEAAPADGDSFSELSYNDLADKTKLAEEAFEGAADDGNRERNNYGTEHVRVRKLNNSDASDFNPIDIQSQPESLASELKFQLVDFPLTAEQTKICNYLIECLDAHGRFTEDIGDVAKHLGISEFDCQQMLYVIQSLEPAGIGARNLEECLVIQLAASENFNPYTLEIVKSCLELLADNNIAEIAKRLHISREDAAGYCAIVRDLSPIPTRGYYTGTPDCYIVPDALIKEQKDGSFTISMNDRLIPPLTLNSEYMQMAASTGDKELSKYLQKNMADAKALMADIDNRQKTLSRLLECIVTLQSRYFHDGKTLRPMRMSEVADILGFNVSTVSRAVHDKYIVCAAGTVSIKSLFSAGYAGNESENSLSAVVIKRRLTELVAGESPSDPLSDSTLAELFEKQGIVLSRRTIAKYRDELGIPSSLKRKSKFTK